jgi:5-methyltetrahydrofolate--homocysteine methyltransferase
MSRLLSELASGRVLLMDGAMGSELYQAGLEPEEPGEEWNLSRPERVRAIHDAYVLAGARCLLTNTFQANPCALVRHNLEDQLERIILAGAKLARAAAGPQRYVLADIGPTLQSPDDRYFSDWDDLGTTASAFAGPEQDWNGIDGILLETCSSPRALSAIEVLRNRVLDHEELPVLLSLSYLHRDGKLLTHSGHAPETFARHAARHGVAALGVNCGREIDMEDAAEVLRRYHQETDLPLFARPNAGTPVSTKNRLTYPRSPQSLASKLPALVEAGAVMIGGCCGTTPAHIAAFRSALEGLRS